MVRVTVESPAIAKAFGNALAFMPARSQVKYARIVIENDAVYTAGTDGYAAGTDWAEVNECQGLPLEGLTLLVDKEALTLLDRAARESKKAPASLQVEGNLLTFAGGEDVELLTVETFQDEHTANIYEHLTELIGAREAKPPVIPGVLCLDPALWSKFTKVKADKGDRKADLLMSDSYEPVLIKIGPTFKGLLMPIEREVHAANVGADGLW